MRMDKGQQDNILILSLPNCAHVHCHGVLVISIRFGEGSSSETSDLTNIKFRVKFVSMSFCVIGLNIQESDGIIKGRWAGKVMD